MPYDPNYLAYLQQLDPQALQELYARQRLQPGLGGVTPGMKAQTGLGRALNGVFGVPKEVASQIDPATVQQARNQAIMQAGLGMLAARDKGAGIGTGLLTGVNQGRDVMSQGLGQAWAAQRAGREDERLDLQEKRYDQIEQRYGRMEQWQRDQAERQQRNLDRDYQADEAYRQAQLGQANQLTPYQAETLRLTQETAARERENQARVNRLIAAQRKYKRGSAGWQLLQDEIDNVSGRSVDRSTGGVGVDLGGAGAPDLSGFLNEEAPVQRPPAAAPTVAPPAVAAPQVGLGGSTRPLPAAAYRSVPEINAAITGGAVDAVTKDDNFTARLNQKLLARAEGISWEEWRRRKGLPPP